MKLLVTGGCGFFGSYFVEQAVRHGHEIHLLDALTYAAYWKEKDVPREVQFYKHTLGRDLDALSFLPSSFDATIHIAAETHVDRSIDNSIDFVRTNVAGTWEVLELARRKQSRLHVQISTDEVYGPGPYRPYPGAEQRDQATTSQPLNPTNPYSATKAAGDVMVQAYANTYGIEYQIVRFTNFFGPRQHTEKLIPTLISCCMRDEPMTLHATGENRRSWVYVEDAAEELLALLERKPVPNSIHHIGGPDLLSNAQVAHAVATAFRKTPLVRYVEDRPGNDLFYRLDNEVRPKRTFLERLLQTVEWYKARA